MKRGHEGIRGEGWLIAAALAIVIMLSLGIWLNRRPQAELAAPVHFVSQAELRHEMKLNINTAGAEEMQNLPGIGEMLAERIVLWRTENGPFETLEEILEVPGLGAGKLEAIRDSIRLN